MSIITIGQLLKIHGLDLSGKIKLVRHKDARKSQFINGKEQKGTPYEWYRNQKDVFDAYQSEQHKPVFKGVDYVVSFIGEWGTTARFIGVYKVLGCSFNEKEQCFYYNLQEIPGFEELKERVIIDWGNSTLRWHQWLDASRDKDVIEITAGFDNIFPGYQNVSLNLSQLQNIILRKDFPEWKRMLSSVNCIYVISDSHSGHIYIGSTYGKDGIWGRWKKYAQTCGHGGNVTLMELYDGDNDYPAKFFTWSILKLLPIDISDKEAIDCETRFKNKFGNAACALNNN